MLSTSLIEDVSGWIIRICRQVRRFSSAKRNDRHRYCCQEWYCNLILSNANKREAPVVCLMGVKLFITTTQWARQIWSLKTGGRRRQGGTDRNRELKIDSVVGIHDSPDIDGCKVLLVEPKHVLSSFCHVWSIELIYLTNCIIGAKYVSK